MYVTTICHFWNSYLLSCKRRDNGFEAKQSGKFHARLVSLRMISRIHKTFFLPSFFTVLWRSTTFGLTLYSCNTYNHHEYGMESIIANCCHISFWWSSWYCIDYIWVFSTSEAFWKSFLLLSCQLRLEHTAISNFRSSRISLIDVFLQK